MIKLTIYIIIIVLLLVYIVYRKVISFLIKLLTLLFLSKHHSIRYGSKNYSYADVIEEKVDNDANRIVLICADDDKYVTMGEIE